ncbi:MAG: formylglycine-generating enzyme family protein, partial [Candidatus Electrothrix sp. AR3]|nr:formylglycine-generating enzyme family protein [Candidatus Electrothrix sp. AR3]
EASLRGDAELGLQLEARLGDALPWAQACSLLQPMPLGLADQLRNFFPRLPAERLERLMALPGTSLGRGGISFSSVMLPLLRQGLSTRVEEEKQEKILACILGQLEKTWTEEYGQQAANKESLAYLAWQKQYYLVRLQLEPDQALKKLAQLEGTPLEASLKADLEEAVGTVEGLRKPLTTRNGRQRLARLLGKQSGLPLLDRYPLKQWQWAGAVVLLLALFAASGWSFWQWQDAAPGEVRLSVLADEQGGTGWLGVEESGKEPQKRSSTEGLLRLPLETRLPQGNWQLVFYDHGLQPRHTLELGRLEENQLIRLQYEKVKEEGKTGQLVLTDTQRNVLNTSTVTLRGALFTSTARADRTLVLPVGEYEVQLENSNGIGTAWQRVVVDAGIKEIVEQEPVWFRDPLKKGDFGPAMVPIHGGTFSMGDIQGQGEKDELPVHIVTVDDFSLGRYEVTVGEFRQFVEDTGYEPKEGCYVDEEKTGDWKEVKGAGWDNTFFAQSDDQPVVCVSWDDVQAYVAWLSEKTGEEYRLPTEAEWEYAARAGTETARYWGDEPEAACGFANVGDAALGLYYPEKKDLHDCLDGWVNTAPVGNLDGNAFALHDMLGNAWEWTSDWYGEEYYKKSPVNNSLGPQKGVSRVLRGGSWFSAPIFVRSAIRFRFVPANRYDNFGFRLARTYPQPSVSFTIMPEQRLQEQAVLPVLPEPEMVSLLGGSFQMGDIQGGGNKDERPVHEVTLSPFAMGKYEVTNAEYVFFLNQVQKRGSKERPWFETEEEDSSSKIQGKVGEFTVKSSYDRHPVNNVSWYGAVAYAEWLSQQIGKNYRLPTEAEWEYAARAGTTTVRYWGNDIFCDKAMYENDVGSSEDSCVDYVRKRGLIPDSTAPMGSYAPNQFGLHDMLGNVWEWCADWYYGEYYTSSSLGDNPQGLSKGVYRVLRGGSWSNAHVSVRSAGRYGSVPVNCDADVGFRLARTL